VNAEALERDFGVAEILGGCIDLLLERAGGERGVRVLLALSFAHAGDGPCRSVELGLDGGRLDTGVEVDFLAIPLE